jgi:hypothetical protein
VSFASDNEERLRPFNELKRTYFYTVYGDEGGAFSGINRLITASDTEIAFRTTEKNVVLRVVGKDLRITFSGGKELYITGNIAEVIKE